MTQLPPKSPRFNQKKITPKIKKSVVQRNLSDASRISEGIPDAVKNAVGSAIMAFSEMEMSAEHFIWDVLGLEVDDGKLLTRIDTNDKFVLAKKLSIRYQMPIHPNDQTAADAWSAISEAVEARNKMAHGVWRMIDGSTPIVISYRIPIETGQINSEEFSLERICEVESLCFKAKKLFDILSRRIAAEGRPKLPSSPDRPNDSELPSRK